MGVLSAMAAAQQTSVIRDIVVRGNRRVRSDVILAVMRTKAGQPYIQDNLDKDKKSIDDLGFFSAVDVRATPEDNGNYVVTVDVEEFPEIKEIRVTGNTAIKTEEILKAITLQAGQVYNQNAVRPSANAVQELYAKRGYFAGVLEFAPLKESPSTINLVILETRVGTVSVQGNRQTKDRVMRRLIKTRSGDLYNEPKISRDINRLSATQFFERVNVVPDAERELGKVDLTYDVKEQRTGVFNIGVQVDPRSSLAGILSLKENNLFGTGQSAGIDYIQTTAGGGASIGLDYRNPFFDNKDTAFQASIYSRVQYRFTNSFGNNTPLSSDDLFIERRTGASIGFARPVSEILSIGISGRFEGVRTDFDSTSTTTQNFVQQDGEVGVLDFGGTLNRRDLDVDPSRGDYARFDIEPGYARITKVGGALSDSSLIGSHGFFRTSAEYRRYFTNQPPRTIKEPDAPRRVLAFRARAGSIQGTVPFFEQYFIGGSDTLRGYDEDRFWGKNMLLTTLEYRYPIQHSFNVIGFMDYGGAWGGYGAINNFSQSDGLDLHLGYGVGVSLRTPLGPIRLDLGFNENGKSRTHFLIGTSF